MKKGLHDGSDGLLTKTLIVLGSCLLNSMIGTYNDQEFDESLLAKKGWIVGGTTADETTDWW